MPQVDAEYLLGYLWEIGPTLSAGGYPTPITHEEILAWTELTGIELEPWEVRAIRRLSGEYLSESHRAEKPDCQAPVKSEDRSHDIYAVAKSLKESLKELSRL